MLSNQRPQQSFAGTLDSGYLSAGQAAKAVGQFLRVHLPDWVKMQPWDPQQPENKLTDPLCRFLEIRCRREQTLFAFFHQPPQSARRVIDLGVHSAKEEGLYVASQMYTLKEDFYVIEAKRLPAPRADREREYVIGNASIQCGGIERFKENLHGDGLLYAGMIAYVQEDRTPSWMAHINQWITDLATHPPTHARSMWSQHDLLHEETSATPMVREFSSTHHRASGDPLHLWHFWLYLTNP